MVQSTGRGLKEEKTIHLTKQQLVDPKLGFKDLPVYQGETKGINQL